MGYMSYRAPHLAVYGNVGLIRVPCPGCGDWSLVVDGVALCCDIACDPDPQRWKRVVEPEFKRALPSAEERRAALWRQDNRCLYCDALFGSFIFRKKRHTRVMVRWDHFVPFSYCADNSDTNFVAACQICNGIKSDKMFQTVQEARNYIAARREAERDSSK